MIAYGSRVALVVALVVLTGSCGSTTPDEGDASARLLSELDAMEKLVQETVAEPTRRERAGALVGDLAQLTRDHLASMEEIQRQFLDASADYDAKRQDLQTILDQARDRRTETLRKRATLMIALKGEMTEAEWSEISEGVRR